MLRQTGKIMTKSSVITTRLGKKKKVMRFSDTFFKKQMHADIYFSFYFPVGYILGHLGLFGLTKWPLEVSKIYQHLYLQV